MMNLKRLILPLALSAAVVGLAKTPSEYVDPFIGTGALDNSLSGNNHPGATVPFGMLQVGPDTHPAPDWYNASGYCYRDSIIYGFSHTRLSGTGASDLIDIALFPTSGSATRAAFSHEAEWAAPGYYGVVLADEDIRAEMTATDRCAIHRYTFPAEADSLNLWIDLDHSAQKGSWNRRIINSQIRQTAPDVVEGYRVITGWAKLRKVYFSIKFNRPVEFVALSDGGRVYLRDIPKVINGTELKARVHALGDGKVLSCAVGISPVSIANARLNRQAEVPDMDFAKACAAAKAKWDDMLGVIVAEGADEDLTTFYTAIYHALFQPNLFSDVNGEYMAADYSVATLPAGERQYTTFSLWDTYRAIHPLYTILWPGINRDFVNSMLRHHDAYGYLPIWHLWGQDNYCMIGNHAVPVVVDAVLKGTPGIDPARAYAAVKQSLTDSHPNSPFEYSDRLGYMPEERQSQSVSITLEEAFDDWCAARLAAKAGDEAGREFFDNRADNYRNLFDPATGFFRAKDQNGKFIEPFDPLQHGANGGQPYTEGNAWHYLWYVPQDVPALVGMLGGKDKFCQKLDEFFTLDATSGQKNDNISGCIGQYAHGNEPSHHVAYLYALAGQPRKTAALVKRIKEELYNNSSSGYAGNDDCGEMSAWYVFSALGFYPVNPADQRYVLGIPTFERATIHLPGGRHFSVTAKGRKNGSEVASVRLNGKKLTTPYITHEDIMQGGSLEFTLR